MNITYDESDLRDEEYESVTPEEQMYYDTNEKSDYLFNVCVFQTAICVLLTIVFFLLSFVGPVKNKIIEAVDYIQSFELSLDDLEDEITAAKEFFNEIQT